MANDNHQRAMLLLLYKQGAMHREAVVGHLGKFVKPTRAVRATMSSRASDRHMGGEEIDDALRIGRRRVVLQIITDGLRQEYVTKQDETVALTPKGIDRLIQSCPQEIDLPLDSAPELVVVANALKEKIKKAGNNLSRGLMDALRIIHRVARQR